MIPAPPPPHFATRQRGGDCHDLSIISPFLRAERTRGGIGLMIFLGGSRTPCAARSLITIMTDDLQLQDSNVAEEDI